MEPGYVRLRQQDETRTDMMSKHPSDPPGHTVGGSRLEADILEEITYLQARLFEMGGAGDCAYERALAGVFRARLSEHERQLARLRHLSA